MRRRSADRNGAESIRHRARRADACAPVEVGKVRQERANERDCRHLRRHSHLLLLNRFLPDEASQAALRGKVAVPACANGPVTESGPQPSREERSKRLREMRKGCGTVRYGDAGALQPHCRGTYSIRMMLERAVRFACSHLFVVKSNLHRYTACVVKMRTRSCRSRPHGWTACRSLRRRSTTTVCMGDGRCSRGTYAESGAGGMGDLVVAPFIDARHDPALQIFFGLLALACQLAHLETLFLLAGLCSSAQI